MSQLEMTFAFDRAAERDAVWHRAAMTQIRHLAPGERFTTDWLHDLLNSPHGSGNVVGSVIHKAQSQRLIFATGERRRSVRPAARGRNLDVWERTGAQTERTER